MAEFPFALNQFTTKPLSFEQDIQLCQQLGVRNIEVAENKLSKNEDKARRQLDQLGEAGLRICSVQPRVHSLLPNRMAEQPTDPDERMTIFRHSIDLFASLSPSIRASDALPLVTIAGRAPGYYFHEAWNTIAPRYVELARYAGERGLRLAFEPLHPVLMNVDSFICNLADASRLIEAVDQANFGLVFDVWHLWQENDLHSRLTAMAKHVFIAHFSDWPIHGPRHVDDRLIPGDGSLDLASLFNMLDAANYRGPYVLEILSNEQLPRSLWKTDLSSVIQKGRSGMERYAQNDRHP